MRNRLWIGPITGRFSLLADENVFDNLMQRFATLARAETPTSEQKINSRNAREGFEHA